MTVSMQPAILSREAPMHGLKSSTIHIRCEGRQGTAFFISPEFALTAYHVVSPTEALAEIEIDAEFLGENGEISSLSLMTVPSFSSRLNDVAVLRLSSAPPSGLTFLPTAAAPNRASLSETAGLLSGKAVQLFGYPVRPGKERAAEGRAVIGTIHNGQPLRVITKEGASTWSLEIYAENADTLEGMSGAAVLDTETLAVIGVQYGADIFEQYHDLRHVSAAPLSRLTELWEQAPASARPRILRRHSPLLTLASCNKARPKHFVGRNEVLDQMRFFLKTEGKAAVHGLGGMGKSTVALEYAYRCLSALPDYPDYSHIFWLSAESSAGLTTAFLEIAARLNLVDPDVSKTEIVSAVAAVRNWFSEKENRDFLLIFDNADLPSEVVDFLPFNNQGHILFTGRNQNFRAVGITATAIELREMWVPEAMTFLLKSIGGSSEAEQMAATELAEELGCLPLALEQAAAYINARQQRIPIYLDLYRKTRLDLLEKARPEMTSYPETVRTTWEINFRVIERDYHASAELMKMGAFLASTQISLAVVVEGARETGAPWERVSLISLVIPSAKTRMMACLSP